MKKKMLVLLILVLLITSLVFFCFFFPPKSIPFSLPKNSSPPILIAHAGGKTKGHPYTNSKEAVLESIAKGFKFIELDLLITKDCQIIAAHDWDKLSEMTGLSSVRDLTLAEIKQQTLGGLSILDAQDINDIMISNPDIYLVTDKITDFKLLMEKIPFKERMLVEVFSVKAYRKALRQGVMYPMLCIWDKASLLENYNELVPGKISIITMPADLIKKAPQETKELFDNGVLILAFTVNNLKFAQQHGGITVTGFYSDDLLPSDLMPSN